MTHDHRIRRFGVEALTRVEGEGGLHVEIRDGQVRDVRLRIFEPPRFFEGLLRGRAHTEPPDITARICGICPVAYQMSACQALEDALGITVDGPLRETDFMLDVNQSLTNQLGGTTGATNYITLLMGAGSAIYQRDINARWRISTLTLWTTADPFGGLFSQALALKVQTKVLGLIGVPIDLGPVLAPLGQTLDALVVPLLASLGIQLGTADLWLHSIDCNNSELVY